MNGRVVPRQGVQQREKVAAAAGAGEPHRHGAQVIVGNFGGHGVGGQVAQQQVLGGQQGAAVGQPGGVSRQRAGGVAGKALGGGGADIQADGFQIVLQLQPGDKGVQIAGGKQRVVAAVCLLQKSPCGVLVGGVGGGEHQRLLHFGAGVLGIGKVRLGGAVRLQPRKQQKPQIQHGKGQQRNNVQQFFILGAHGKVHTRQPPYWGAARTQRRLMVYRPFADE